MMPLVSINSKIRQLAGLAGTISVSVRENDFIESIVALTHEGKTVSILSEAQIGWIETLWKRHFA